MGTGKKELEIVYNLQWKNVSGQSGDKANIVGMYDIPATTLNWETFKSYLLKNSGATGDDVKVSYVSIDDKEFPIESQLDFQIALYSFRQRARNGDIITLKLDRLMDTSRGGRMKRLRRSAEPRMEEEIPQVATEPVHQLPLQNDGPPEWFKKYMKGYKKEIVEDVTASVISYMSTMKTQNPMYLPCYHSRKAKVESCKRSRKAALYTSVGETTEKDVIKSLKLERKLDSKLEKLEQKTMKIKEKKNALLRGTEPEVRRNSIKSRPIGMPLSDTEFFMDASAVGQHESTIQHMSGGETYQQEWEVINTGGMSWTRSTELRYAWGSEALKPVDKAVPCPKLEPGEKGTVDVYLEIPKRPGNYECYWHFYHQGRRFGHWLGCHIIVDPSPVKLPVHDLLTVTQSNASANHTQPNVSESLVSNSWSSTPKKLKKEELVLDSNALDSLHGAESVDDLQHYFRSKNTASDKPLNTSSECIKEKVENLRASFRSLQIEEGGVISDSSSSSDTDNQSIVSIADSNSSTNFAPSDEFVVVPMPQCLTGGEKNLEAENLCIPINDKIKLEKICVAETSNLPMENSDNNNNTQEAAMSSEKTSESKNKIKEEPPVEANESPQAEIKSKTGFAYVIVNGQKVAVPKRLLRSDYLATAEEAPAPNAENERDSLLAEFETISQLLNENLLAEAQKAVEATQNPKVTQSIYVSAECIPKSPQAEDIYSSKPRLFVFPLNCPGFEVVYPPSTMSESLPPELNESFESNRTTMAVDGSTISQQSYVPEEPPVCPADDRTEPLDYSWSKSNSAYAYCHEGNPPPPPPVNFPRSPSASSEFNPNNQQTNKNGTPRIRLNQRFSNYMRHGPPRPTPSFLDYQRAAHNQQLFNGQPHWSNYPSGTTYTTHVSTGSAGNFVPYWSPPTTNSTPQNMYELYHMPGNASTKAQSPVHTNIHEEMSNSPPGTVTGSTIHILPDTLVSGAVNVASSAINTARSVINMFTPSTPPSVPPSAPPKPEQIKRETDRWVPNDTESPREKALRTLAEMGFWDRDLNITLLTRYNDDLARVISELVQ